MASLRKLPNCKNFIACFTDIEGKRRQRSTGTRVRKDAQAIAEQYEAAARGLRTQAQIRKVLADLFKHTSGTQLKAGKQPGALTLGRRIGGKR